MVLRFIVHNWWPNVWVEVTRERIENLSKAVIENNAKYSASMDHLEKTREREIQSKTCVIDSISS